ncbi:hypothetical protein EIP91_000869 [Steccherinum ochraceum]|uniref:C2H2-type domain-containing protein n=1 Tax=Steccherinum ochraceum TaxID=92696 RepID=A0A4R0RUU0_9APHY|nr:hypothetical protein EIP91_000869 [Steccherinum ochraceum]
MAAPTFTLLAGRIDMRPYAHTIRLAHTGLICVTIAGSDYEVIDIDGTQENIERLLPSSGLSEVVFKAHDFTSHAPIKVTVGGVERLTCGTCCWVPRVEGTGLAVLVKEYKYNFNRNHFGNQEHRALCQYLFPAANISLGRCQCTILGCSQSFSRSELLNKHLRGSHSVVPSRSHAAKSKASQKRSARTTRPPSTAAQSAKSVPHLSLPSPTPSHDSSSHPHTLGFIPESLEMHVDEERSIPVNQIASSSSVTLDMEIPAVAGQQQGYYYPTPPPTPEDEPVLTAASSSTVQQDFVSSPDAALADVGMAEVVPMDVSERVEEEEDYTECGESWSPQNLEEELVNAGFTLDGSQQ